MQASVVPRSAVVVLAGGSGSRVGAQVAGQAVNKAFLPLAGRALLLWSLHTAAATPGVQRLILVLREQDRPEAQRLISADPPGLTVEFVPGGASRHASEANGINALRTAITEGTLEVIAVHDAARPLASSELFAQVLSAAAIHGGAVPGMPAGTLYPQDRESPLAGCPDDVGHDLVRVQTPQALRAEALLAAYDAAARDGFEGTDTSSCVEHYGTAEVVVVPGPATNLKVTYPGDVPVAEALLAHTARA